MEELRMQACQGIYFADEPAGRVAKVAGSGLGVWEVIRDDNAVEGDETRLREILPHIGPSLLTAARKYYSLHREEIDELIADNEAAAARLRP
jgi:hypothetical protein